MANKREIIWLIKEGEPLPIVNNGRLMRTGLLGKYFASKNDVIWWASTFIHGEKKYIANKYTIINIDQNYKLNLLHSPVSYEKNVSIKRFLYHFILGVKLSFRMKKEKSPSIIVCSYPSIDMAYAAVKFAVRRRIPVIIDVRDMWPDIYFRAIPKKIRFLEPLLRKLLNRKPKFIFKNATTLVGMNPSILKWAQNKVERRDISNDECIYLGYKPYDFKSIKTESMKFWTDFGISNETWNIIYIGTFSRSVMDLNTIIFAFNKLNEIYNNIRLIIAGSGDEELVYKKNSINNPNIIFPGWINRQQIEALLSISNLGIYPIKNLEDFYDTISNKFIEYLSAGIPILSSLQGLSRKLIEDENIGLIYEEGNINSCFNQMQKIYTENVMNNTYQEKNKKIFYKFFDYKIVNKKFDNQIMKNINKGRFNDE
jgi:glycosyltransferase involved in cell wall biosynthesis